MEQVLDERPTTIECIFCQKPMHKLLLGDAQVIVWTHEGEDAKVCRMVKFEADFVASMTKNIEIWKKDFEKFHSKKKHRLESCHNPKKSVI